jgi:aspartyl aminopeptidase
MYSTKFLKFIENAKTPFHAVMGLEEKLIEAGFVKLLESKNWDIALGGKYYVCKNDSSIIAFTVPTDLSDLSINIAASHTDSPTFKVKPNHTVETAAKTLGMHLETYGGTIYSSWLDRPLSVAGRVILKEGNKFITKLVDVKRPLCVIPNVAIHQNRSINDGYKYNPAVDMVALYGSKNGMKLNEIIAKECGLDLEKVASMELYIYNCERGFLFGADNEFIGAPQIDNLECAYLSLQALLNSSNNKSINLYASFDNEEVGSGSKQGALSTFLLDVLQRVYASLSLTSEDLKVSIAKSMMVSCDNAHATHPNQPSLCDPLNRVYMNEGIVIKTNANLSYTTDAISFAIFSSILNESNVKWQVFANRSDTRGGSTLGHLSLSQVSLDSIDIGLAQLAMHSSSEVAGVADMKMMVEGLTAYYNKHFTKDSENNFVIE